MTALPLVKWSYSTVSSFDKCPRQYHETRVLKTFKSEHPAAAEGVRIHKVFEDRIRFKTALPPEWAHWEPMVKKMLALGEEAYAEQKLKLDTSGAPINPESWDYWVVAILDVLVINREKGVAYIGDWKTGKAAYADLTQMKLCALLVMACYPEIHTVNAALLFIKEDKPVFETYTRDSTLSYWEQLMPLYHALRKAHANGVFNAKPSGLCKVCPVKTCEHYRGG
jgi:hypothetical protein